MFLSVVSTNPATLLGYGTWAAFGQGRMLLGWNTGDTDEATGGSATHTHAGHTDHAALTHAGTAVGNHTMTQPTIGAEAAHTHTYTQTVNHVHVQTVNSATTGGLAGYTPDTSSNTPAVSGYSTQNPTGGVAQGTTAAGSSHAHTASGAAVDAHSVTQPSQHAAQTHSAHDSPSNLPPYVIVRMWKRTA